ncbi:MAG: Cell division protein FtsH [Candidatus Ozemobacter sibiricus]|jgi:cell division protease FtsH|uniref:ATP-dependent zinc metalloprotease FtsH n=1 Tax=Candidatus Ozemobacter sibiricus TaxID=2268124 RepID=A0A367ZK98_9BACT|nr:MAG: Cell division protein FtsH [Candidatus Ozemobacter sibiricus]
MKEQPPKMKTVALYIILLIIFLTAFVNIATTKRVETIKYSEFVRMLRDKDSSRKVINVKINDREITGQMVTRNLLSGDKEMVPAQFRTVIPEDPGLMEILRETPNITIDVEPPAQVSWWLNLLINIFPFILLFGAWVYILQKMQGGGAKALSFGKSRARMVDSAEKRVLFKDVAGVDEAKQDLEEVVEFLKEPAKFTSLGAKIPRGVLLYGPPGTGKTLLARAVAGEANVPFFNISGSEFVEMFVGVGASRVRDLFEQARKNAPCIVFMDEIDAVGRQRGAGLGGGHDEREQTLNQLLVEMDGFDNTKGIILVAATNRPDVLDPALLRPGRFDRRIVVDQPDIVGREQILKIHVRDKPIADDVNLQVLARRTPGFVGADLANLANEAAILAARHNRKVVRMSDFEEAIDRVIAGSERKSRIISEREKTTTAVHEMGHALVAASLPGTDPVHKITIIPRGMALGLTMQLPVEDRLTVSKTQLFHQLCILLAGRIAEEMVFGELTSGAKNDIERATKIARKMVCELGMSEEIGPVYLNDDEHTVFLGRDFNRRKDISEEMAKKIDHEVRRLIDTAYQKAKDILTQRRDDLERISKILLERETITGQELTELLEGRDPFAPAAPPPSQPPTGSVSSTTPGEKGDSALPLEPSLGTPEPAR